MTYEDFGLSIAYADFGLSWQIVLQVCDNGTYPI